MLLILFCIGIRTGRQAGEPSHWLALNLDYFNSLTSMIHSRSLIARSRSLLAVCMIASAVFIGASNVSAQWVTESYELKTGWNAIWLSSDASHDSIENLINGHLRDLGSGEEEIIKEVWKWNPIASASRFTQSPEAPPNNPDNPVQPDSQWFVYKRGFPANTTMTTFTANAAYLIRVADGVSSSFTLQITGRPIPPSLSWNGSGLNFFGFPLKTPLSTTDRNFERFLSLSDTLSTGADIFRYNGGPLGASNPVAVTAPRLEGMTRGQAYWIKSTEFSAYYGPLRVAIVRTGLDFGETSSVLTLRVENVTTRTVTATLTPASSVTPPTGQPALAGTVPLQVRGAFDPTTGQFSYDNLVTSMDHELAAGETKELVIVVDRPAMGGSAGDVFQSILQITDSLNISRIDLPVRAVTTSRAGLWIGAASVSQVDQISTAPVPVGDGTATVDVTTNADAEAPDDFPIRLILHRDESGVTKLLQQVYVGPDTNGDTIVAAEESLLDSNRLKDAHRVSSSSFPLDEKVIKTGADLGLTGVASFQSVIGYAAATNPFVHAYHPDHDNKDAQFSPVNLPEGDESYTVARDIEFQFAADGTDIGLSELGWGSTVLGGHYKEIITGLRAQPITVKGTFLLRRVSDIGTLTE